MSYQVQIVAHWPGEIRLFIPWVFPHDGALGRLSAYPSADALRERLQQAHIPSDTASYRSGGKRVGRGFCPFRPG
jgi:hypothetical protein